MVPKISLLGINIDSYAFFNFFGWVVMVLYNLFQVKRKETILSSISVKIIAKNKKEKHKYTKYCTFVESFVLSCIQFFPGVIFNILWGMILTNSNDNYFGFALWAPIFFIIVCAFLQVPPLKQLDLYTPAYALSLVSFKIACFFAGCCHGIEWKYGMYNFSYDRVEFPIQLLECLVAVGLFLITHFYSKKNHKIGTVFPLYLILYSATRFFTEFLRDDFPRLVGTFTTYHFQCLIGVVIGLVEMCFVVDVAKKIKWLNSGFSFKKTRKNKNDN